MEVHLSAHRHASVTFVHRLTLRKGLHPVKLEGLSAQRTRLPCGEPLYEYVIVVFDTR